MRVGKFRLQPQGDVGGFPNALELSIALIVPKGKDISFDDGEHRIGHRKTWVGLDRLF